MYNVIGIFKGEIYLYDICFINRIDNRGAGNCGSGRNITIR